MFLRARAFDQLRPRLILTSGATAATAAVVVTAFVAAGEAVRYALVAATAVVVALCSVHASRVSPERRPVNPQLRRVLDAVEVAVLFGLVPLTFVTCGGVDWVSDTVARW